MSGCGGAARRGLGGVWIALGLLALAPAAAHAAIAVSVAPSVPSTVSTGDPAAASLTIVNASPGGLLTDSATLSGLATPQPGSTVTFRLYPPADPACAGVPAFTDVQPVALAGSTGIATSLPFRATALGTYRWVAAYSGDVNNAPVAGSCGDPAQTRTVASGPAPPPFPAKLEVARARVISSSRRLDVLAPITARASGRVNVSFEAAGRTERFTAPIDALEGRVTIDRRIPAGQARLGTGILTLSYPGDADTQPQDVRLRAAAVHADLVAGRPTISAGRLKAAGRISTRARGVVRLQLLYEPAGADTRTLSFSARISSGRYRFDAPLDADVVAQLATRRGVVHSHTLFTGHAPARMRGEMASFQVLGAP